MSVTKGDKVKIDYTGSFEDGEVFDSSEKHGEPLECQAGAGQLIPGFDNALIGMEKGEEKEITIKPEDGYGEVRPEMEKAVPRDQLPKEPEPKVGMMLMIGLPTGQQMPAKIKEIKDNEVVLDLNHPLAGKTLKFKIKMVDFEEGEIEEPKDDDGCGGSCSSCGGC